MNELQALRQQRAELDAKIAEQEQAAKATTLTQVKELLDNAGLSAEEALRQLQQKPRANCSKNPTLSSRLSTATWTLVKRGQVVVANLSGLKITV